MRIMGLDYGSRTVGVAVSDPLLITAQPLLTIERDSENKIRKTLAKIAALCEEYDVSEIVIGLPKNMNNTMGERAEKAQEFAKKIEARTGIPVKFVDERLTTVQAEKVLMEGGVRREHRKEHLDSMAASLILSVYLDSRRME
ncbi:MAG: Holliday junction resolvase RuvX [Oscillospiraceae bacterium]|nr:Holliday junction resolvase RuvX [Oscillospiraceae bacterium]